MERQPLRVLVVEDSPKDAELLAIELRRGGYEPAPLERVDTAEAFVAALERKGWDIILCDYSMPRFSAPAALSLAKEKNLDLPFIVVSGTVGEETAVEALRAGAHDFMTKNKLARLLPAIKRELADARVRSARREAEAALREEVEGKLRAQEQLQVQVQHLGALRSIDMAITGSLDLRVTLGVILEHVTTELRVDAASVLLLDPHSLTLRFAAGRGFRTAALQHTHLPLGEGHAGLAALERRIVRVPNLTEEENGLRRAPLLANEGFVAYFGVPLIAKGQVKGVLEIFRRESIEANGGWMDFLEALAGQAAIAIDSVGLFDDLQQSNLSLMLAYDATIEGWSRALDLRDKETEGHTRRVNEMTLRLARSLGMSEPELVHVRRGALLHDIGKMGIPDQILHKPGPLTEGEWELMRKHPVLAFELLSPIGYLKAALEIPYCHHEKWDGTGYPRGLAGEQIPLAARIFTVVDVWDALTSDRPYRAAWPKGKALEHIRGESGRHFDPRVVEAFLAMINER
jgi:putative nucleotidyltransferase with HDIG domain